MGPTGFSSSGAGRRWSGQCFDEDLLERAEIAAAALPAVSESGIRGAVETEVREAEDLLRGGALHGYVTSTKGPTKGRCRSDALEALSEQEWLALYWRVHVALGKYNGKEYLDNIYPQLASCLSDRSLHPLIQKFV